MKTPRALRWLPVFVLAAACEDTLITPNVPARCWASYEVERVVRADGPFIAMGGPLVVPVGGSQLLRVRLASAALRQSLASQGCPRVWSLEGFRWTIEDASVARLEQHSGGVVTITGLAVGETVIEVKYDVHADLRFWMRLEVVAP